MDLAIEERLGELRPDNAVLLTEFLERERLSGSSQEVYFHTVQGLEKACSTPLSQMEENDLKSWFNWAENKANYSSATLYIYATRLRRILTYVYMKNGLSKREARNEADKIFDVIPIKKIHEESKRKNRLRDKLVSPKEFRALMDAASHARVQALLAVMYDSACRSGELRSLRIRDLEFRDKYALIRVYGKTGERTIPLIQSLPYLRAWLQVHPDPRPDVPVFARVHHGEIDGLSDSAINTLFHYLRKKAGIKRRIHPHMLRHTRLTELAKKGLGEFQMKSFAGWTSGSNMANIYIKLAGSSHLNPLLGIAGLDVEQAEQVIESPLVTVTCPRCGNNNPYSALFCYSCSYALSGKVALDDKQSLEQKVDDLTQEIGEFREMFKVLIEKPELIEEVKKNISR